MMKGQKMRRRRTKRRGRRMGNGIRDVVSWIRVRGTLRTGRQIARRHAKQRMLMLLLAWWGVRGAGEVC
jgi:hypothetical protein